MAEKGNGGVPPPNGPPGEQLCDHYLLYSVNAQATGTVKLRDQFTEPRTLPFKIVHLGHLGAPASKRFRDQLVPVVDPRIHLTEYRLEPLGPLPQVPNHKISNQFGEVRVAVAKPQTLLVPAAKDRQAPPDPPPPLSHSVDHFLGYDIDVLGPFEFLEASAQDQFTVRETKFKIGDPIRLYVPVSKNGEPIKNPECHLLSYRVSPLPGEPPNPDPGVLFLADQIDKRKLTLQSGIAIRLLVPSLKTKA